MRLRDGVGLRLLASLLARPGQEQHVLDLSPDPDAGHAAPGGLDHAAKVAYRQRMNDLRAEIDQAEDFNDGGRAEHLRTELTELTRRSAGRSGWATATVAPGRRPSEPGFGSPERCGPW